MSIEAKECGNPMDEILGCAKIWLHDTFGVFNFASMHGLLFVDSFTLFLQR